MTGSTCVTVVLATAFALVVAGGNVMSNEAARVPLVRTRGDEEAMNMLRVQAASHGIDFTPSGLIKGLDHRDANARVLCLQALARVGDLVAVEPMGRLLDDPERMVRVTAVQAINEVVVRKTKPYADKLYNEAPHQQDRFQAALLLCRLGDPSRFRDVLRVLRDHTDPLIGQALGSTPMFARYQLYDNGNPVDWVGALSPVLLNKNSSPGNRLSAAIALAAIGSREALAVLRDGLANETDSTVRYTIRVALKDEAGGPANK